MRFDCALPLALWELRFEGAGRLFERAEHVATRRDAYETVEIQRRPALHRLARAALVSLRPRPTAVASRPLRAARLGRRARSRSAAAATRSPGAACATTPGACATGRRVPYWRWFGMIADPDNFLVLNNVGTPDGGETAGGFLMRDGVLAPIVDCETESELDPELGCQRSFVARARDATGATTTLAGRAIEVAPLRQRRDGRLTHVNEGLTEYDWDGRRAIGISEYLIQRAGRHERRSRTATRRDARTTARRELLQRLIRFDTTNPPGNERECIAFIDGLLRDAGYRERPARARARAGPTWSRGCPGRGAAPPLLLYGHVDVVTTAGQRWTPPPVRRRRARRLHLGPRRGRHEGRRRDDARRVPAREGARASSPPGDVIFCALADEEDDGRLRRRVARARARASCSRACGTRSASSAASRLHQAGRRFYPIQVAEKQVCTLRATVRGPGGHGSMPVRGGAMARLATDARAARPAAACRST